MGGNRRYPYLAGQLADQRHLREARKHGPLASLSEDQLALHRYPVTIVHEMQRIHATAWLRFGDADVEVPVRVRRWTSRAVGVEFKIDEDVYRCWIWQGACGTFREGER